MDVIHSDNSEQEVYLDIPCQNDVIEVLTIIDGLLTAAQEANDRTTISIVTILDENNNELV